ncbi:MAG: DUF1598 domain-containing protein [Pirellulales bacterium]
MLTRVTQSWKPTGRRTMLHSIVQGAVLGVVVGLASIVAPWSPIAVVRAEDQAGQKPAEVEKKIAEHIAAGEFGPARVLAQVLGADQQNAVLNQVAAGQLAAGARGGFANAFRGSGQVQSGFMPGGNGGFVGGQPGFGMMPGLGGRGGAAMADFQPLMDLIQNTTGMPSPGWQDDGGVGTVEQFPQGVLVDARGMLSKGMARTAGSSLTSVRSAALESNGNRDVRKSSALRKVSLSRLEREVQLRRVLGQPVEEDLRSLAGLQRIQYVLVYPETGDVVIAGPAGDWTRDAEGRMVSLDKGRPVVQLDDLIVLLQSVREGDGVFGCSINPRNENLVRAKAFVEETSKKPLKPGQRDAWVAQLRDAVGIQDIKVFGIDPRTRAARILVEADYRMKLVGMGLEEGVLGVTSYLDSLQASKDGVVPPMDVLRWWFTVNYDAVQATESHDAFELRGQGVKVLSENELLTERGDRVHTGKADLFNRQFTESFTKHFPALAAKYPVYAELQNIFDLALVAALIKSQDLSTQTGWQMAYFGNPEYCPTELGVAPREVESIVNHRVINRTQVVVGVSGGVSVDVRGLVTSERIKVDSYGKLEANRAGGKPKNLAADAWWWD